MKCLVYWRQGFCSPLLLFWVMAPFKDAKQSHGSSFPIHWSTWNAPAISLQILMFSWLLLILLLFTTTLRMVLSPEIMWGWVSGEWVPEECKAEEYKASKQHPRVMADAAGPCSDSCHPRRLTTAKDGQHRESARNKKMNREDYKNKDGKRNT